MKLRFHHVNIFLTEKLRDRMKHKSLSAAISGPLLHHRLPPWIRSFVLFRHRRVAIFPGEPTISSSSGIGVEGVFRESIVIHSFTLVDPILLVFDSYFLYSRDL